MEEITKKFGQRVRSFRKKKKLSQEQLAELCELHPTYIGQLERGEKNASLETVARVCRGLDISPQSLFENLSIDNNLSTASEIYELIIDMSEKQQTEILEIIRRIKNLL